VIKYDLKMGDFWVRDEIHPLDRRNLHMNKVSGVWIKKERGDLKDGAGGKRTGQVVGYRSGEARLFQPH